MSEQTSNPFEPPAISAVDQHELASTKRVMNTAITLFAGVGLLIYVALGVALVFGDSTTDTYMGTLLLCNVPLLVAWFMSVWVGGYKIDVAAALAVLGQIVVTGALLMGGEAVRQVLCINAAVVLGVWLVTLAMRVVRFRSSRVVRS